MVMIHGGGYGQGDASQDMSEFINSNENKLIVVTIQYRVCHFTLKEWSRTLLLSRI